MKTPVLNIEFLNHCDQIISVSSDFEDIKIITKEKDDNLSSFIYLNIEDCQNLIESLKLAVEHHRNVK